MINIIARLNVANVAADGVGANLNHFMYFPVD